MDLTSLFRRRTRAIFLAAAALAAVSLVASACGGDDDSTAAKTATTAPTTGAQVSGTSQSTSATSYPLKVKDMAGRDVEIKAKPKTIVAVSPTAVEMVYAAGGAVVGRSSSVDFPAEAKSATDVGSAYKPSAEKILQLKPDLIVGDSVIIRAMPDIKTALDGTGVPVVYVGAESYQDVLTGLDLMGKVLDGAAKTNQVKANIEKAKTEAKAALGGKSYSVVGITADQNQQLYAGKENSYVGDIMKQLGLANPAKDMPDSPQVPGYSVLPPEKLLQLNPDYIFAITPDPRAPALGPTLAKIPAFKDLKAITANRVIDANVELFLLAPGPRIADAFKAVAAAFAAPASGATPAASATTSR
ncbi:MAG: ABC transporter substrate-binding protein [Chloroflexi bacterium]|nr:ABC transporter substrate-binding protein [Chloroflexota bacterium]